MALEIHPMTSKVQVGQAKQLKTRGSWLRSVHWSSTDPVVATVSKSGLVKGMSMGSTLIFAQIGRPDRSNDPHLAVAHVIVTAPPKPLAWVFPK